MRKVWIDAGFDEKSLNDYHSVRVKVDRIWTEARGAVSGSAAKRSKAKQKLLDSSAAFVDILACRYTLQFVFKLQKQLLIINVCMSVCDTKNLQTAINQS